MPLILVRIIWHGYYSAQKDNVPSYALPLNLPQLFYASISRIGCILRVVWAILVAWIKWFCSSCLKFPPIKIECSCSFNTLKLARMMVANAGNESDHSELLSGRFGSEESATSIFYVTIKYVLCWCSYSVQKHETCQYDGTYCRQYTRALRIGFRIFWHQGIGQTGASCLIWHNQWGWLIA